MPIDREKLKRLPVIGYVLRCIYILVRLPTAWVDIHRELVHLRYSLGELQSSGRDGDCSGIAELVRSRIIAELTDHTARLGECEQESARATEALEELSRAARDSTDRLATLGENSDRIVTRLARMDAGMTDCSAQLREHEQQISHITNMAAVLDSTLGQAKTELSSYHDHLSRLEESENTLRDLNGQNATELHHLAAQVNRWNDWKERTNESLAAIINLTAMVREFQRELDRLDQRVRDADSVIREARNVGSQAFVRQAELPRQFSAGQTIENANFRTQVLTDVSRPQPVDAGPVVAVAGPRKAEMSAPVYLGGKRLLIQTDHQRSMVCASDDVQITPRMIFEHAWEPALTRVFHAAIKPGMTYLEGGAHIGYFTVLAAGLVGFKGQVHAFEPVKASYEMLEMNARLNRFKHICELHRTALWDVSGELALHRYCNSAGSSTLSSLPERLESELGPKLEDETVCAATLDELYAQREITFDFVKLDTEGAEMRILCGGSAFFRTKFAADGIIALEYNPPAMRGLDIEPEQIFDFFRSHDWRAWRLSESCELTPVNHSSQMPDWNVATMLVSRQNLPGALGLAEVS